MLPTMKARHVLTGFACHDDRGDANPETGATWCGAPGEGWSFQDPTHLALYGRQGGGSITVCSACVRAIVAALQETEGDSPCAP